MKILEWKASKHEERVILITNDDGTQSITDEEGAKNKASLSMPWGLPLGEILNSYIERIEQSGAFWMKFYGNYLKSIDGEIELQDEQPFGKKAKAYSFVANGQAYTVFPGTGHEGCFLGFGGARVTVTLQNGVEIKSNNMWTQGKIPAHFLKFMPDNATIVWK